MDGISLQLHFDVVLRDETERVLDVFRALAEAGLQPAKISDVEPIRASYSESEVLRLLDPDDRDLSEVLPCRTFTAVARHLMVSVRACRGTEPGRGSVNAIDVNVGVDRATAGLLVDVATSVADTGVLAHAALDLDYRVDGQRTPGTINDRLPGVVWANFFSTRYIEFFGVERFQGAGWSSTDERTTGTVAFAWDVFDDPPADLWDRFQSIHVALGASLFSRSTAPAVPQLAI